jgi:hypothetical protein
MGILVLCKPELQDDDKCIKKSGRRRFWFNIISCKVNFVTNNKNMDLPEDLNKHLIEKGENNEKNTSEIKTFAIYWYYCCYVVSFFLCMWDVIVIVYLITNKDFASEENLEYIMLKLTEIVFHSSFFFYFMTEKPRMDRVKEESKEDFDSIL